jgi:hypothetical protein
MPLHGTGARGIVGLSDGGLAVTAQEERGQDQ